MPLISHAGLFTGKGLPVAFATGAKGTLNSPGTYAHFNKLAKLTTNQGEADLAGAGDVALGVIVDVSPKGDTGTVETAGFEYVNCAAGIVVGDLVTTGAAGALAKCAGATPTLGEFKAGVWQVAATRTVGAQLQALICLDARL